jgi:hypothetical protein
MTDTPTDKKLSERLFAVVNYDSFHNAGRFVDSNIHEILSGLRLAESRPSAIREAVEGCADMAVVSGELPATLGNAVSDAIFEAIKRGMEVDEAVSVVVAVASDYGCNAYGEAYRRRLAELVRAHRARGEEKGNG